MICLNKAVFDEYTRGKNLNEAIEVVHGKEIAERRSKDIAIASMKPLNMVMMDAKISKSTGKIGDIMNFSNPSMYTSGMGIDNNQYLFPAWVEYTLRQPIYESSVLKYLVSDTVGVPSRVVQSPTLNLLDKNNVNSIKKSRVAEGADIPTGTITIGGMAISLYKRGRAIKFSYEAAREMAIPLFITQMQAIRDDIVWQNQNAAVDVLVNGDGNGNEATKIADFSGSGGITAHNLMSALIDYYFENHYLADVITMNKDAYNQFAEMTYDSNRADGASRKLTFSLPQIGAQTVTVLAADVPQVDGHDILLLSNGRNSLVRYEQNGSTINEMQNFATNQTNIMTFTETSGFAIQTKGSNRYIKL